MRRSWNDNDLSISAVGAIEQKLSTELFLGERKYPICAENPFKIPKNISSENISDYYNAQPMKDKESSKFDIHSLFNVKDITGEFKNEMMDTHNDSIIWTNRSQEQLESNLSLVASPPSSTSQQEESLSDESQYTKSSQLDLALEDERRWLKYRVENLTRDECVITCVLAQMILSVDELPGKRDGIPTDDDCKQSLLYLSYGEGWMLNDLRTVLDLAEFLPVGLRRLGGLGVRDRGLSSRKLLEARLEQCLDLSRRLNIQET